jgi:subtilisin family serine protease
VAWHSIARVGIFPTGIKTVPVSAELLDNGQLVTDTVLGPQVQGQLDTLGNYQLANGVRGNLFEDTWIKMSLSERTHPFMQALKVTERRRAVMGSEIPRIRQLLTTRGLTGAGIKIGILDGQLKDPETKTYKQHPHTRAVGAIINDPVWGVAPAAQVEDFGRPPSELSLKLATDNYQAFSNALAEGYKTLMQERVQLLDSLIVKRDPGLRVLNDTWGSSQSRLYLMAVSLVLEQKDDNGYFKYPNLRQTLLGPALSGSYAEQMQIVVDAVDTIFATNPLIQATKAQYVDATRRAAGAGLILVKAASNEGMFDLPGVSWKAGAQMDFFAESPYVITVAAANTRQQPGNRAAYKVAGFSSRGDGQSFNPTIAAPGREMGISLPQGEIGHNLVVDGTSFSTPFVCGVIAMMLQRNPWLTFEQVKAKLQATAVQAPGYGPADYGAGFVNAEAAVLS